MDEQTGLRVGIVRDERYLEHKPGHTHPEHPRRLRAIYRMLETDFPTGLIDVAPELATLDQLELAHTPAYVKRVLKTADQDYTSLSPDTPASAKTYLAAWLAVGGCLKAIDALLSNKLDACFALIRPPGHHALPARAGGFCIFNNPAIAARYAAKSYGLKRILIVDWDVHHGNGINELFYDQKGVLYFSTHDPLLYPFSGAIENAGKDRGEGYTINVPLPRPFGDQDMLYLYREILEPVIKRYRPQLIIVDAGFDGHAEDPIGRMNMTEKVFGSLTRLLLNLREEADSPPVLLTLEGGYSPRALALSVKEVLQALTESDRKEEPDIAETPFSLELLEKVRRIHAAYGVWTD